MPGGPGAPKPGLCYVCASPRGSAKLPVAIQQVWGEGLTVCISAKFSGAATAAFLGPYLEAQDFNLTLVFRGFPLCSKDV